jgi:hypothetical protein
MGTGPMCGFDGGYAGTSQTINSSRRTERNSVDTVAQ